jgi:hypothetical protein
LNAGCLIAWMVISVILALQGLTAGIEVSGETKTAASVHVANPGWMRCAF